MTSGTWESSFHIIITIVFCLTISVCMQLLQPFTWVSIIIAMLVTKVALGDWDKEKDTVTERSHSPFLLVFYQAQQTGVRRK